MKEISMKEKAVFLRDVFAALKKHDLLDIVGIRLYPGESYEGRVEITEGRANINLRPIQVPPILYLLIYNRFLITPRHTRRLGSAKQEIKGVLYQQP